VLLDAMAKAVAWYHERLLHGPDAGEARDVAAPLLAGAHGEPLSDER